MVLHWACSAIIQAIRQIGRDPPHLHGNFRCRALLCGVKEGAPEWQRPYFRSRICGGPKLPATTVENLPLLSVIPAVQARHSQFSPDQTEHFTSCSASPVPQCGLNVPILPPAKAENLASCTASSATQCRSNPVSGPRLPKTGIFQISAGDYRRFRSHSGRFRNPETASRFAKARH
jgi:hypothetical protein